MLKYKSRMMKIEHPQNLIEKESVSDFLKSEIEKTILNIPEGVDKKTYLLETLSIDYGMDLSRQIVDSLPDDFFNKKTNKEETETPSAVELERKRNAKREAFLQKDIGLSDEKIIEINKDPRLKKFFRIGVYSVLAVASLVGILKTVDFKKDKKETVSEKGIDGVDKKEKELNKTVNFDKRFNGEVYASLPEGGKNVYKYMAEENPTPGKWYQILDKDSAQIYVFDQNNNMAAKIIAGFGEDEGDMENTSEEFKRGIRTTPAGVCLFSNYIDEKDTTIYGKLQFSLIGKSVLGEIINLGQHQTYPDEIEPRTKKLNTPTPKDNKFSNGCINISEADFKKYIKPHFQGNYSEFLFILQDKKSRDSGVKFDAKELVESVIPMITEMANRDMNTYINSVAETKRAINIRTDEIENLESERARLAGEYAKDKNINKQKKIEGIKNEIKNKKNEISQLRGLLAIYNDKIKGVTITRNQVEEIITEMD